MCSGKVPQCSLGV